MLRTYGWRAYAVPVLAVLTVFALVVTFWGNPFATEQKAALDPLEADIKTATEEVQNLTEIEAKRAAQATLHPTATQENGRE